jgi:hypothetical protein
MTLNCPMWLKVCLKKLDIDGDGIDPEELHDVLDVLAAMRTARDGNCSEIDYSHFPAKVKEVLQLWDGDRSGKIKI